MIATSPERDLFLVLGMHRSGTSALSGVLHHVGCSLPRTLIGASENNTRGYFESRAVQRFNDDLLARGGSHWADWRGLGAAWFASPPVRARLDAARDLLVAEFEETPLGVLKDPRICRLVPFWAEAAARAGYRLRPVLIHRNPLEVAASLRSRNEMEAGEVLLLWLRHMLDAELATRGMRRCVTTYARLLDDWAGLTGDLQDAFGLSFPRFDEGATGKVEAFLSAQLRHHEIPAARLVGNPACPAWVRDTYTILDRWAVDRGTVEDRGRLDRIRAEFDAAGAAFGALCGAPDENRSQLAARLKTAEAERASAQTAAKEDAARLKTAEAERASAQTAAKEAARHAKEAETALGELRRRHAKTEEALDQERTRAADLLHRTEQDKTAFDLCVAKLDARIDTQNRDLGELARLLSEVRRSEAAAEARIAEIDRAHKTLAGERDRHGEEAAELGRQMRELRASTSWRLTRPLRALVDGLRGTSR